MLRVAAVPVPLVWPSMCYNHPPPLVLAPQRLVTSHSSPFRCTAWECSCVCDVMLIISYHPTFSWLWCSTKPDDDDISTFSIPHFGHRSVVCRGNSWIWNELMLQQFYCSCFQYATFSHSHINDYRIRNTSAPFALQFASGKLVGKLNIDFHSSASTVPLLNENS